MRPSCRGPRAALLAAAALVFSFLAGPAPASAEPFAERVAGATDCDPAAHRSSVSSQMARLNRVDDQPAYTARQLRRIDRRLDRRLARVLSRSGRPGAPGRGRLEIVVRIPVHAHVIDGANARGPSRRAVRRQITILNRAYSGGQSRRNVATRFRFYLESFDRSRNQRWYTASLFDRDDKQLRRRLHRGGPDALNLYFSAPQSPQADSIVLGWSTVPWRASRAPRLDGVTVHQESMRGGDLARYNRGDTAVHEVGHWLGLFHTFEGGCSPQNDRVDDTPAEALPSLACEVGRDSCEAEGKDPIRNFMNYSYDTCMNMFTAGQVARMTDNWLAYRTP